jgi:hypothetical protein
VCALRLWEKSFRPGDFTKSACSTELTSREGESLIFVPQEDLPDVLANGPSQGKQARSVAHWAA